MSRTPERISFQNSSGQSLAGRLHRPVGPRTGVALFAHCFTCSKDLRAARDIADSLADEGITTLRFDFTGLGQSEGEFAETHFSSNVDDLLAASDWLREHVAAPQVLVGHSLGGSAVLVAAPEIPECVAVATIGAPSDPAHVANLFEDATDELRERGEAEVKLGGRPFRVKQELVDDIQNQTLLQDLPGLKRAVLFLHSPQDNTVGVEHARALFQAARHPKSFVSLDGADHLLSTPRDAAYAGLVIAGWARRYLPEDEDEQAKAKHRDDVEVRTGPSGFRTSVIASGVHRLIADEPTSVGGTDTGPTPYDLLSAALGACTTMTLRMYADRKEWPLEEVIAHVRHDKIHAKDCERCETQKGKVDRFQRTLELVGPLDEEQRQRLLEIADRCPVHRTLHSEINVETTLS